MKLKTRQLLTLDRIVIMTSMISSLTSLTVTILIMIIFISDTAWSNIIFDVKEWILNQQWDASVRKSYINPQDLLIAINSDKFTCVVCMCI